MGSVLLYVMWLGCIKWLGVLAVLLKCVIVSVWLGNVAPSNHLANRGKAELIMVEKAVSATSFEEQLKHLLKVVESLYGGT